ncbi:MAG: hypothetical protein ABSC05_10930 [Candidatus Solibacter sp.]
MRGQIHERDLLAAALGYFDVGGQVFGDGIVERDFAAPHHVGEDGGGEDLGGGADLENRIVAHRPRIVDGEVAVRDETASVGVDDADGDRDVLMQFIDAAAENRANLGVGGDLGG